MLFKPLLPLVEYAVFYDYIKNELCINKEKPELNCNGKCYLMQQLSKASESENDTDKSQLIVDFSIAFFQQIKENFTPPLSFYMLDPKAIVSQRAIPYTYLITGSVFRPPIV